MEETITHTRTLGKIRSSETYATTLKSFMRFRKNKDMALKDITADIMVEYEAYLHNCGISPNSSSFYLRNLRAIYNRAVEKGLTKQQFPFQHVYTGIERTIKRAVPLSTIQTIKSVDLSMHPSLDYARDMFMFSFYTRGMSFVDMAYLRKKDLTDGTLSYRRRKTKQRMSIRWERCMQEIVDKYDSSRSSFLLPIIRPDSYLEERRQYIYASHNINHSLKVLSRRLEMDIPLTMYVARHSWASIARSKNIPLAVISEGMGHESESTTRIYLASLSTNIIDEANSMIIESLF